MNDREVDNKVEEILDGFLRSRGLTDQALEDMDETEFNSLCADAQIDAYLKGKLDGGVQRAGLSFPREN